MDRRRERGREERGRHPQRQKRQRHTESRDRRDRDTHIQMVKEEGRVKATKDLDRTPKRHRTDPGTEGTRGTEARVRD